MEVFESIILGAVQGLTEFLPVSSSGHLQLAKELLGVELEENLTFDVALHAATVLSTIVVLWREIVGVLKGLFTRGMNQEKAYIMVVVGAMLLVTATLLAFAYYAKPRQKETISYRDALIIGVAQAVAATPGLSRSGSTIATGLLLGNRKEVVATFSFLMVLAPIMGETLLHIVDDGFAVAGISTLALVAGFVTAFVVGCLACRFMIDMVKRGKLIWFALYCAVVGIVAIGSYIF